MNKFNFNSKIKLLSITFTAIFACAFYPQQSYADNTDSTKQPKITDPKFKALLKKANQGDAKSQVEVAETFLYGNEKKKIAENPKLAQKYYELAVAQEYPPALYNLFLICTGQEGGDVNYPCDSFSTEVMMQRVERAAELGHKGAASHLGYLYRNAKIHRELGELVGGKKDLDLAIKFYQLAGDAGLVDLGQIYEQEESKQDYQKALEYYQKSHSYADLGRMYEQGKGVPQDFQKAMEYYKKSLKLNQQYGYENILIGQLYEEGKGVKQDYKKAMEYYEKKGSGYARFKIGLMYEFGKGVKQDMEKAWEYYRQFPMYPTWLQEPDALYHLANLYKEGKGTEKNLEHAKDYYDFACTQDYKPACEAYKQLTETEAQK